MTGCIIHSWFTRSCFFVGIGAGKSSQSLFCKLPPLLGYLHAFAEETNTFFGQLSALRLLSFR